MCTLVDWELLKKQLRDRALMQSYQEDTISYVPNRDEDDDLAKTVS